MKSGALEYSGTSLATLFAQKRNLVRPRFWSMLKDLLRFYREAPLDISRLEDSQMTLGDYLSANGYGAAFREDHLLPMACAVWRGTIRRASLRPCGRAHERSYCNGRKATDGLRQSAGARRPEFRRRRRRASRRWDGD